MAQILDIQAPVKGVHTVTAREQQPPGTCWNALNVFPYDAFSGHRHIAQRFGLAKMYSTNLGSSKIQGMLPVNAISFLQTYTVGVPAASTAISTFSHVPATVSTATNTIAWPTSYIPPGGDPGVVVGSTILIGSTCIFNLVFSGSSTTNAGNNLYISLNQPSTSWSNPAAGNDEIDLQWQYNPVTHAIHVEVDVNNSTGFQFATGDSTGTLTPGVAIPCSFTWAANGNVTASFGALSTNGSTTANQTSTASTMQLWADGTGMQVSTNQMFFVGSGSSSTVSTGQIGYNTLLVAVCAGNVWLGDTNHIIQLPYSSTVSTRISSVNLVSLAFDQGIVFIADGSSTLWSVNVTSTVNNGIPPSTVSSTTPVASPGNIVGQVPTNCRLVCNWRGRVVLAGDSQNVQNWYMARPPGTYFNTVTSTNVVIGPGVDWDYSQTDSAAPVAGNLAHAGKVAEPITALMPFSDDYLKFGCSHSLWMAQGDPADGGTIVQVSNSMGILGKDAWCVDYAGTMWMVATGGLYHVRPAWEFYRPPEPVSWQTINQQYVSVDPGQDITTLVYDPDLHYMHNFFTAIFGGGDHLTLDMRTMDQENPPGIWPQQFPSTMGPTAACLFFADANPNHRTVLIGGRDGFIRTWKENNLDDDGTPIISNVTLGPFAPVPKEAAVVTGITLNLGELPPGLSSTDWNVQAVLAAGPTAYSVTEGLFNNVNLHPQPVIAALNIDGRQKTFRQRLRGGWFSISLQNGTSSTFFSFESGALEFNPSGPNRLRK